MITVESCKYMQEAIFRSKVENPDGSFSYRFSIPTLLPMANFCNGVTLTKSNLANKNADPVILTTGIIRDDDTITLPYNVERFGDPNPGDSFVVCFLGGDPTRCTIIERR